MGPFGASSLNHAAQVMAQVAFEPQFDYVYVFELLSNLAFLTDSSL
jgi:hypothetical protein